MTDSVAKSGPYRYRHGWIPVDGTGYVPNVRHGSADHVVRASSMKDRRAVARSMSDEDLKSADKEFAIRARMLGKPGKISAPHQAVKDEISRRKTAKNNPSQKGDRVATTLVDSPIEKVGAKGYEHGWKFVGTGGGEDQAKALDKLSSHVEKNHGSDAGNHVKNAAVLVRAGKQQQAYKALDHARDAIMGKHPGGKTSPATGDSLDAIRSHQAALDKVMIGKAATLVGDDMTYFSFPIEKQEVTEDGDIVVFGKATDGTVDSDLQIVDPDWSAKAIQDWLSSGGNVRVQHQARRDPAGRGLDVEVTPDGHYVKALIVEPVAKQLVKKGVLTAYSVGISHPDIRPDPTGKAMNGIITGRRDGHTKISEISLVDRGSNFNSKFQLVKSRGTGIEFVGKMLGSDDEDVVSISSGNYKPSDLAALLAHKSAAAQIEKRNFDPNVGGGVDRDKLKDSDFAGPGRSFPIVTPGDVSDAASSLGRTKHDPAQIKSNIISIAHRKGPSFVNQLPDSWKDASKADSGDGKCGTCKGTGKILEGHRDCPDCDGRKPVDKCHSCDTDVSDSSNFCPQCGTKLSRADVQKGLTREEIRAALLKGADMSDDDHDSDGSDDKDQDDTKPSDTVDAGDDDDDDQEGTGENSDSVQRPSPEDDEDSPSSKKAARKAAKAALNKGKPTPGDVPGKDVTSTDPVPAHREPDGAAVEAFERDAGLPTDADSDPGVGLGGPEGVGEKSMGDPEVGATLRLKSLGVPTDLGKLHDMTCPCYHPSDVAKAWPDSSLSDVVDEAYWANKALDMAASAPLPLAAAAQRLWQHAITLKGALLEDVQVAQWEMHKAFADANPGPGSAPTPSQLSPQRFKRPYLSAGHAAQSPGASGPNTAPITAGQISASQYDRGFLASGHAADSPSNKAIDVEKGGRTFYTNTGRDQARNAMAAMHDHIASTFPDLCPAVTAPASAKKDAPPTPRSVPTPQGTPAPAMAGKADAVEDTVTKIQRKALKRLEKAVLAGELTLAEAQVRMSTLMQPTAEKTAEPTVVKAAVADQDLNDVITKAVTAAVAARDDQLNRLEKQLKRQAKLIEQMAEQPAPNGPYRGMPLFQPPTTSSAVPVQKSSAERSQEYLTQLMLEEWRTNPDPSQREAAWAEITKMR